MPKISTSAPRLLIAGGGTGGHLFPGIALGQAFLSIYPAGRLLFVVKGNTFERSVLDARRLPYRTLTVEGLKGRRISEKLRACGALPLALLTSRRILQHFKPDRVIGVGGYVCGPLVLMAWLMRYPVALQEQNVNSGITNRLLLPMARRMYVAGGYIPQGRFRHKIRQTGNPLRQEFTEAIETTASAADGTRATLAPSGDRGEFTILVLGGSQGAHAVNQAVMGALAHLDDIPNLYFIHQTGPREVEAVRRQYAKRAVAAEVAPFFDDMLSRYRGADLVICRAGALTVAEITAMGKAALLIPFPFAADNHQELNARSLQQQGAGSMLRESELTPELLAARIRFYKNAPEQLQTMGINARQLGRPQAARDIILDCFDLR